MWTSSKQPNYPFAFWQADVTEWMQLPVPGAFDVIHASPPCHDHSTVTGRSRRRDGALGTGWILDATAAWLKTSRVPWVIENVEGARMPDATTAFRLCGSSFGLDVRRHRKFVSSELIIAPPCDHGWQTPRFISLDSSKRKAGQLASVVGVHGHLNYAGEREVRERAMGIDWMTPAELAQAIPPAYTQHIGEQLMAQLEQVAA